MLAPDYKSAIEFCTTLAPSLNNPSNFISWAEDICAVLVFVYDEDYDKVTEDLYEAVKYDQGFEEEEED